MLYNDKKVHNKTFLITTSWVLNQLRPARNQDPVQS